MNPRPIRVLLVEDDQDDYVIILDYLCRMKEGQYELDWICSAPEALREVGRSAHDVYLFDYRLGPDNGLDLLREARAGGCTAPILLLTRYAQPGLEAQARQAGAADFLNKNQTNAASLDQALLKALGRAPPGPAAPAGPG